MPDLALPVLVHHPTDTEQYWRLASAGLPGVDLRPCHTREEIEALLPEVEIVFGWRIPRESFRYAARLLWLQGMGAGIEDLLDNPLIRPGARITRVVGIFGPWIAEYTLAQVLAWRQRMARSVANQAAHRWDKFLIGKTRGLRFGVAGLGSVGREVAALAAAVGMSVSGFDLDPRELPGGAKAYCGTRGSPQLYEFLAGVDVLSINLPLTAETDGMFGEREFVAMPRGSFVVNTARGRVIDEGALVNALQVGHLGGAALDVFAAEPLPLDSPLWDLPGVAVTSHISGPSTPAEVVPIFVDNYRRYVERRPLVGLVRRARRGPRGRQGQQCRRWPARGNPALAHRPVPAGTARRRVAGGGRRADDGR